MFCTACGSELDAQGNCLRCAPPVSVSPPTVPSGDAFVVTPSEVKTGYWKPLAIALSVPLFLFVLVLNFTRALRWAGTMTAESFGYMLGGVLVSVAAGFLGMFLAGKARGRKVAPPSKTLGIAAIAVCLSIFALAGERASKHASSATEINHQVGDLLKEAAGTKPSSGDSHWWDAATRDFFHDILEMNQQYTAEVAALDNSAIKDLYSVNSYRGKARMEKVVAQLQAALAVDEKYASLDPLVKKLEERIAEADASEKEKQEFLTGLKNSMDKSLAPRNEVIRGEEAWMKSTIDLYEYVIAHASEYSIRGDKLYFQDDATKDEFTSRQAQAIALYKEFLQAKRASDSSRKNGLDKLGVAPSDLPPAAPAPAKPS